MKDGPEVASPSFKPIKAASIDNNTRNIARYINQATYKT